MILSSGCWCLAAFPAHHTGILGSPPDQSGLAVLDPGCSLPSCPPHPSQVPPLFTSDLLPDQLSLCACYVDLIARHLRAMTTATTGGGDGGVGLAAGTASTDPNARQRGIGSAVNRQAMGSFEQSRDTLGDFIGEGRACSGSEMSGCYDWWASGWRPGRVLQSSRACDLCGDVGGSRLLCLPLPIQIDSCQVRRRHAHPASVLMVTSFSVSSCRHNPCPSFLPQV